MFWNSAMLEIEKVGKWTCFIAVEEWGKAGVLVEETTEIDEVCDLERA